MTGANLTIDFFKNGALVVDPSRLSSGGPAWPVSPELPAALYDRLIAFWFDEIRKDDARAGAWLRPLSGFFGLIAFNLFYQRLAQAQAQTPHLTITVDPLKPMAFTDAGARGAENASLKDWVAALGQKALFLINPPARVHYSNNFLVKTGQLGKAYRLRRVEGVMRAFKSFPKGVDATLIDGLTGRFADHLVQTAEAFHIHMRPNDAAALVDAFRQRVLRSYSDSMAVERLMGRRAFDVLEGSVSGYVPCHLGLRAMANGGVCHSTCHGEYFHTMNMADAVTVMNCSVFWGATPAIAADAIESATKIPSGIRCGQVESLEVDVSKPFLDRHRNDQPRDAIKTVMILGRHVPMYYSADFSLDFACILQFYRDISRILCDAGYDVVFKAHPESEWRHFDKVLDPRVRVEWRSFEKAGLQFDAVVMDNLTSSIMPSIIARPVPLFLIRDDWHYKSVSSRQRRFFDAHATALPAALSPNGFYQLNEEAMRQCFKTYKRPEPGRVAAYYEGFMT